MDFTAWLFGHAVFLRMNAFFFSYSEPSNKVVTEMEAFIQVVKFHGKNVLMSIMVLMLLFVVSAGLIGFGTVAYDARELLVVAAMVTASFGGSFLTVKRCGEPIQGFFFSGIFFLILLLASFTVCGLNCINAAMVKRLICIFAGTIFGNFCGQKRYYKLRNSRRRSRATTKWCGIDRDNIISNVYKMINSVNIHLKSVINCIIFSNTQHYATCSGSFVLLIPFIGWLRWVNWAKTNVWIKCFLCWLCCFWSVQV